MKKTLRGKGNIDEQKIVRESQKRKLTFRKAVLYYTQKVKESQSQMRANERAGGWRRREIEGGVLSSGISDLIACFIQDALDETDGGVVELQRGDLAQRFNWCAQPD